MSIEGLVITLTILVIAALWIAAPLLNRNLRVSYADVSRDRLTSQYERLLTNIRDLDEDFATGKMAADRYQSERETWVERGIQLLMALDSMENKTGTETPQAIDAAVNQAIEDAVASYRRKRA